MKRSVVRLELFCGFLHLVITSSAKSSILERIVRVLYHVEYCPPVLSESPHFPSEAADAKEAAQNDPSQQNTVEYYELMEDEMIRGLQRLGWTKVDVSFHSVMWP